MKNYSLPKLDDNKEIRELLLPLCRLSLGEVWADPICGHRVGCLDATDSKQMNNFVGEEKAELAIHDPPYNFIVFDKCHTVQEFIRWCEKWIETTNNSLCTDSTLYIWLGAEQDKGFQPLPDFMLMMRKFQSFSSRSLITMRNQRGYGTQNNWMAVRQECLCYIKNKPQFTVQYTDIPKILRGYYKEVNGKKTENLERSKSKNIRPGNVWVDVQQVFYRIEENVNGCYAQKPLKSIERLIAASSHEGNIVLDFFGHSGTTLIASERLKRRCFICDIDPIYCEIMLRRLERFREYGKTGWQNSNPFEEELHGLIEYA